MTDPLRSRLGEPLWALASARDSPLVDAQPIGTGRAGGRRRVYRLTFADGSALKGRQFSTPVRAAITWRILRSLTVRGFPRPIAQAADAMLEPWIDGDTLVPARVVDRHLRGAGRLLGSLHASAPPAVDDLGFQPRDGEEWLQKTATNLRALRDIGAITAARARTIEAQVAAHLSRRAPVGIVHHDFCPENLIEDARGLTSIDNGTMTIGAIDYDIARVWYRWPMRDEEHATFGAAYRESSRVWPAERVWKIVVVLNAARRVARSPAGAADALRRLDEI